MYYPIPGVWQLLRYLAFYSSNTEPPVFKLPKNMRILVYAWISNLSLRKSTISEGGALPVLKNERFQEIENDVTGRHIKMFIFRTCHSASVCLYFGRRFKPITPVTLHEHTNHFSWLCTRRNMSSSPEFCIVNGLPFINVSSNFGSERTARSNQIWSNICLL
jgi:hypothetical protein